jgi:hypothetical protein
LSSFEDAFTEVQKAAETAAQAAANVANAAKGLAKAAREGDIAKLRKAADRLGRVQDVATQEVTNARESWSFTEQTEEEYLRDHFAGELLAQAKTIGLRIFQRDDGLVCFPSLLKILPAERAIRVDRKRVTTLRPSFLAASLNAAQAKKSKFDAARFLEALHRAYLLLAGQEIGATVPLERIYEVLTLLPGVATDYAKADFGRDLLMLDQSGINRTKGGAVVSLPASTGTKGSRATLSIVGPEGNLVTFYGLRFTEGERP